MPDLGNECHSCLGDHLLGVQGRDDHPQPPPPDRGGARGLPPPLPADHRAGDCDDNDDDDDDDDDDRTGQARGLRGLQVRE